MKYSTTFDSKQDKISIVDTCILLQRLTLLVSVLAEIYLWRLMEFFLILFMFILVSMHRKATVNVTQPLRTTI